MREPLLCSKSGNKSTSIKPCSGNLCLPNPQSNSIKVYNLLAILQKRKQTQRGYKKKKRPRYIEIPWTFVYWSCVLQPCKTHPLILVAFLQISLAFLTEVIMPSANEALLLLFQLDAFLTSSLHYPSTTMQGAAQTWREGTPLFLFQGESIQTLAIKYNMSCKCS